jgi:hypothetical protein
LKRCQPLKGKNGMDYLALQFAWYLLAAFGFGLVIGWCSCSPRGKRT